MTSSKIFLLPVPLSDDTLHTLPEDVKRTAISIKHFFVENIRTARRFLKIIDKSIDIDSIHFSEINNHTPPDVALLKQWIKENKTIGIMSEAGCPGVADPGSKIVEIAQMLNVQVIPLVGPSSILLSLMASGFNGQSFRFVGYLPVKEPMRSHTLKELEEVSFRKKETQIFIETPYRNNQLLETIIKQCKPQTKLCIAANITAPNESIFTKPLHEWEKQLPDLHKQPVIFLIGN